jgi:dissimilatory sulfite reductase (desulfoviridin) alpha/beta subunit
MAQTVVKIENLVKRYKELIAVDHFNLDIKQGEVFGLLGPNGDGTGMSAADRKKFLAVYRDKVGPKADASRCCACDKCHPKCPQHIKVSEEFRKINVMVESFRRGRA